MYIVHECCRTLARSCARIERFADRPFVCMATASCLDNPLRAKALRNHHGDS